MSLILNPLVKGSIVTEPSAVTARDLLLLQTAKCGSKPIVGNAAIRKVCIVKTSHKNEAWKEVSVLVRLRLITKPDLLHKIHDEEDYTTTVCPFGVSSGVGPE